MATRITVRVIRRRARKQYALRWEGGERIAEAKWGDDSAAYREAFQLEERLNNPAQAILAWATACEFYETTYLATLSRNHIQAWRTARRAFEAFYGGSVPDLPAITTHRFAEFAAHVNATRGSTETMRNYCRYLRGFFNWAVSQEWIDRAPMLRLPRRVKGERRSRGRAISGEEFDRMTDAAAAIVGEAAAPSWHFLLRGLWHSSLRLNEAVNLHWSHGSVRLNLSGEFPMIDFPSGDKGGHRRLPVTPEFADMLRKMPHRGYVFNPQLSRGVTRCMNTWCHKIGEMGGKANIIVEPTTQKRASAHDLRRSFLQRWRGKLDAAVLQILARHESYTTTQQYYLSDEADSVAAAIWGGDSVDATILKELRNGV